MSKILVLLPLLIFLVSCGDEAPLEDSVGNTRTYFPVEVNETDRIHLQAVCDALISKGLVIGNMRDSQTKFSFGYAEKKCTDSSLNSMSDISATINAVSETIWRFDTKSPFVFTNVETYENGIMAKICEELENDVAQDGAGVLKSPIKLPQKGAIWFTTTTDPDKCKADNVSSVCINMQTGLLDKEDSYSIHTEDWIKFSLVNPRRGFFTERLRITGNGCTKNDKIEYKTVLK